MDVSSLFLVVLAAGLGGWVQGLTGFGSTVVALPLLGLVLDMHGAVAVGSLLALAINLALVFRLSRHIDRPALLWLLGASVPGMVAGAFVLRLASELWLKTLLGLVVVGLGGRSLCRARAGRRAGRGPVLTAGLAAGCLGVAIGINGPPVVAWAAAQDWDRPTYLATLNAYFLLAGGGIVGIQAGEGWLTPPVWKLFGVGLAALLLGVRLGTALGGRLDAVAFRRVVAGLLVLVGLGLLGQVGLTAWSRPGERAAGTFQSRANMVKSPIHPRIGETSCFANAPSTPCAPTCWSSMPEICWRSLPASSGRIWKKARTWMPWS